MNKKLLITSFVYAIIGMLSGAFYREFTKFYDYSGETVLSVTHTHLIVLGTFLFLILFLYENQFKISSEKMFRKFYLVYNLGLGLKIVTMYVRGITEITGVEVSSALNGAISGISGVSHMILAVSLIMLYVALKRVIFDRKISLDL
ncbi:MAG: DUF2871 domain-containing protein [Vulcanibacillus sp.]